MNLKKPFLILSFFTVSVVALLYGVSPDWFFQTFLSETHPPGVDQSHMLRAVMLLYLSIGIFCLWAAFSEKYQDAGIIVIGIFCAGLVAGRMLSVIVDGLPSLIFIFYIFIELSVIPACVWLLRRKN